MNKLIESINIVKLTIPNFAFANFVITLQKELEGCDSVLDVGCGSSSALAFIHGKEKFGVDGHAPSVKESKRKKIHDNYLVMDVRDLGKKFKKNEFDAVIAIDVIEHLDKKEGFKMLTEMERIARKKVIILTPNGFVPQFSKSNHLQEHVSGWDTKEFKKRKYKVYGMYGLKMFRGEEASLKYKPKILFGIISEITQYLYTKTRPQKSFSLFAVLSK